MFIDSDAPPIYIPPEKKHNLYCAEMRVWSGDDWPPYPLIDVVARCAKHAGASWSFKDQDGRHISY